MPVFRGKAELAPIAALAAAIFEALTAGGLIV
jgi:hypothetical protein